MSVINAVAIHPVLGQPFWFLTGFPRFLRVFESQTSEFKAWKVLENKHRSLKVLELNLSSVLFMGLYQKWSCQRQNKRALMIGGGDGLAWKNLQPIESVFRPAPAEYLTITARSRKQSSIVYNFSTAGRRYQYCIVSGLRSHLNDQCSMLTFDFAINRTLCKGSTSFL